MKRLPMLVVLLGLPGCHGGVNSRLAGGWVLESGKMVRIEEGTVTEEEYEDDPAHEPAVIIRDDGTFDWRCTVLGVVGMYTDRELDLRHKGDRIDLVDAESGKDNGYIGITDSRYSVTSSYVVMSIDDKSTGMRARVWYRARLRWDGKMDYESVAEKAGCRETRTALMRRCSRPLDEMWESSDSQEKEHSMR